MGQQTLFDFYYWQKPRNIAKHFPVQPSKVAKMQ
jgi:hypothetical protein